MSRRRRPLVASEALSCLDWHLSLSLSLPFFFPDCEMKFDTMRLIFSLLGQDDRAWTGVKIRDRLGGLRRTLFFLTMSLSFWRVFDLFFFWLWPPWESKLHRPIRKEDLFEGTRGVCRAYGNVGKNQWFGRWGPSLDKGTEGCHVDEMCWQAWSRVIFSVIVWSEVSTFYCACYACLLVLGLSALVGEAALWIVRIITAWN